MKISFIIPTLNRPKILYKLFEDLNKQILKNFEIIVIDQSDNFSLKNINIFLMKKNKVKIIKTNFKNASEARNLGITNSIGEIIFFLDDDVRIYDKNFISKINYYFCFPSIKILSTSINHCKSLSSFKKIKSISSLSWINFPLNIRVNTKKKGLGRSCSLGIKKKYLNKIGFMDENFYRGAFREETEFLHRAAELGIYTNYIYALNIFHKEYSKGGIRADKKFISDIKHCYGDLYFFYKSKQLISFSLYFKHFFFRHFMNNKKIIFINPLKFLVFFISSLILLKVLLQKKKLKKNKIKKIFY